MKWRPGLLADPEEAQKFLLSLPEGPARRFAGDLSSALLAPPATEDEREDLFHDLLSPGIEFYFRVVFACWRAGYAWEAVSEDSRRLAEAAMRELARHFLTGPIQESWAPTECLRAVDALGEHMTSRGLQDTVLLFVDELTGLLVNRPPPVALWELEFSCLVTVTEDHEGSFLTALKGVERDVVPWALSLSDPLEEWVSCPENLGPL